MKALCFLLSLTLLSGCIHFESPYLPNPYTFPETFFVTQELSIRSLRDEKKILAQLERKADLITMVLTDPQTMMILLKIELRKNKDPVLVHQAPVLEKTNFAAAKVARVIQELYETPSIPLHAGEYKVKGPGAHFLFRWSTMKGTESCQFPSSMLLTFEDEPYDVTIDLLELDCSL